MWAGIVIFSLIACFRCEAVTHWFVTEKGMINNQIESVYNLRESYNLVTFLRQENFTKESEELELELARQKKHIEDTEDKDHDLEKRFLQTDPDCVISEKPIEEFDLYTSTVLTLENKGIRPQDFIHVKGKPKKLKKPNCTKIFDLPFSMYTYEHLHGMQMRSNVTGQPEKGLFSTLPENDELNKNLNKIGHYINKALTKNESSWILYDMATYYWRIKGDALMAIECARRSLHFSSRNQKDIALLNLANILHRGQHSADAVILTHAALGISKDVNGLYFTLANVYGALGEFNSSLLFYEQTLQKQPDFEAARKRIHAIYCQRKLEAALEAQHDSLQRTLSELREYQKLNDHFQKIQEKILDAQVSSEEQYERNMNYHRQKLQNEAHKCLVKEEKESHYFVCKREHTPIEMFGNPLILDDHEIGAIALGSKNSHCVLTEDGAVLCFNFTIFSSTEQSQANQKTKINVLSSSSLPALKPTPGEPLVSGNAEVDTKPATGAPPANNTPHDKQSPRSVRSPSSKPRIIVRTQPSVKSQPSSSSTSNSSAPTSNTSPSEEGSTSTEKTATQTESSKMTGTAKPPMPSSPESENNTPPKQESSTPTVNTATQTENSASTSTTIAPSTSTDEEQARILAKQQESDRMVNDPKRTYVTSDDLVIIKGKRVTVMKRDDRAAEFHAKQLSIVKGREMIMPKGWLKQEDPNIKDDWTAEECQTYNSLPDWKRYSLNHVHPDKKGVRMVELFNDELGLEKNDILSYPYYQPTCVQESNLEEGDTVMDYVEGIIQRGSMHNYKGEKLLAKEFLKYGLSNTITMEEMGERVRKAWQTTNSEDNHWMVYNHAGLYWRINGNLHQAIECFRRAVHYVPVEFGDVPLVNVANLMQSIGKYKDAIQLLRMALVVNKTEPLTYYLLGNVLAATGNMTLAAEHYRQALKIDEDYRPAKSAFHRVYCYVTFHCKKCEKIIPRWKRNHEYRSRLHKRNCRYKDGVQTCKTKTTSCDFVSRGEKTGLPGSCYIDDPETNTKGDTNTAGGTKKNRVCQCEDGLYKQHCCKKEMIETSSLSDDNIENSASHKNNSPYSQQPDSEVKTDSDSVDQLLSTHHYISVNRDATEEMTVGLKVPKHSNTEIMKDENGVPASVYGPKIPATPVITEDFIKLIGKTQKPWPTIQECTSFKKLNLLAYTSTWLSVHAKGISIHDYIDFKKTEPNGQVLKPECRKDLGASLLTLDHLEGIARRSELQYKREPGLIEILQNIGGSSMTVDEVGTKIAIALSENRNNWIAANLASLFWRVAGDAKKAIDCSRVALFSSPSEHKDLALINLMNILHRAGYSRDAIVIGGISMETSPHLLINCFTLANIHFSLGQFTEAIRYYEKTLEQQSNFRPAIDRLKTIKCTIINHQQANV